MADPTCTIQDGAGAPQATTNGVDVTPGNTITIQLASLSGVGPWGISIVGTDELVSPPALSINSTTKTATFTAPAAGSALIFQSVVNNGQDGNGNVVPALTGRFGVYTMSNGYRVFAYNERVESAAIYGWSKKLNIMARAFASAISGATGQPTWQLGTDAAYQITGTSGAQRIFIPTLTGARTYKMPTAPTDGMPVGLYDGRGVLVNAGNTLSVTTVGGTDHFWVGGVDKGTTYQLDANLFKGGTALFERRAASNTWELSG